MLAKPPRGQCFRLPVGQEVHDAVALQIDQDGSVTVATAPSPVINGKGAGRRRGRLPGGRSCHAQQRIGANRHGEAAHQSRSGFAAEGQRDMALQTAEPLGPAGGDRSDVLEALSKRSAGAGEIATPEPADSHSDRHGSALPGQVAELAEVAAMDPLRRQTASGTVSRAGARFRLDGHMIRRRQHAPNLQGAWNKGQQGSGHGQSTMDMNPWSLPDPDPKYEAQLHGKCGRTQSSIAKPTASPAA